MTARARQLKEIDAKLTGEPDKLQSWGEACAARVQEIMKGRKR